MVDYKLHESQLYLYGSSREKATVLLGPLRSARNTLTCISESKESSTDSESDQYVI